MADTADLLTTAQVAVLVNKSVATVNRWAASGKLKPAMRLPGDTGAYLFRIGDVERLREPAEPVAS